MLRVHLPWWQMPIADQLTTPCRSLALWGKCLEAKVACSSTVCWTHVYCWLSLQKSRVCIIRVCVSGQYQYTLWNPGPHQETNLDTQPCWLQLFAGCKQVQLQHGDCIDSNSNLRAAYADWTLRRCCMDFCLFSLGSWIWSVLNAWLHQHGWQLIFRRWHFAESGYAIQCHYRYTCDRHLQHQYCFWSKQVHYEVLCLSAQLENNIIVGGAYCTCSKNAYASRQ